MNTLSSLFARWRGHRNRSYRRDHSRARPALRRLLLCLLLAWPVPLLFPSPTPAEVLSMGPEGWREIAPQGFGNPANNVAWGMAKWSDNLYVSTTQSWGCWSQWALHVNYPTIFPYPPDDEEMDCATDIYDNPLTGEIWRWLIKDESWEQVHAAPHTIPIPDHDPLARDVGYRALGLFSEPDDTTALYASGMLPQALVAGDDPPPPRILRSTDGVTFDPLPQEPGTTLGEADRASFRDLLAFKERLLVVMGSIYGSGPVWEATDPATGNNAFAPITPEETYVFEMADFQNQLYLGTTDEAMVMIPGYVGTGYRVLRSDLSGLPPYEWTTVVDEGAYLEPPSRSVVSMATFNDQLYVGTDIPTELIRINPDDSWELIMGEPRDTPLGFQAPLSGYGTGFDWPYNVHVWRMTEYGGRLYVGTADDTWKLFRDDPATFGHHFGFDLYFSDDGWYFYPLSIDGFGDPQQWGVRNFATISKGLVMGTGSFWTGLRLWLLEPPATQLYLPLVVGSAESAPSPPSALPGLQWDGLRPLRLEGLSRPAGHLLSWEGAPNSARYLVYRSRYSSPRELGIEAEEPDQQFPLVPELIGTTSEPFFVAALPAPERYRYTVVAESASGERSPASNGVTLGPNSGQPLVHQARGWVERWLPPQQASRALAILSSLEVAQRSGSVARARADLDRLAALAQQATLPDWRQRDIDLLLYRLERQLELATRAP